MKAFTVWQPWATLIAIGAKPFEFRGWKPPAAYVGQRIAIHAGMRLVTRRELEELRRLVWLMAGMQSTRLIPALTEPILTAAIDNPGLLPRGSIVATAILGEAVLNEAGDNDSDRKEHATFAWPMLDVVEMRPPIAATGKQGFWEWHA